MVGRVKITTKSKWLLKHLIRKLFQLRLHAQTCYKTFGSHYPISIFGKLSLRHYEVCFRRKVRSTNCPFENVSLRKMYFRQNFDRMSFNKVNKQQRFYSLPKQYKQTRRFEQTPFVGNYLQPTDLIVNLTFPVFHVKQVDDYEALPCYPYRDDAILLHHVIWDYVREVLEGHYGE